MHRFLLGSLGAICVIASVGAGDATAQVGTAVAVVQNATAARGEASRTLRTGNRVTVGERVATDAGGRVQLLFSDETKLVVGPGSSLLIDEYVLNPDRTASQFTISALGGTFRFISGNSPKNAYLIDTPIATIGVRGSAIEGAILPDLRLAISVMEGPIEVCLKEAPPNRRCMILERTCGVTIVGPDGFRSVRDTAERNAIWREHNPGMYNQAGYRRDFQLPIYNCGHLLPLGVRPGRFESDNPDRPDTPDPGLPPREDDDDDEDIILF